MGAQAPVKYHYPYRLFTYSVRWDCGETRTFWLYASDVPGATLPEDIVRWGVWLGRHIC